MGTRSDYYIGRGENAEWLGSIGLDGHPDSHAKVLAAATTEEEFRKGVADILANERARGTTPEQGWPWPWENSRGTDYSYAFDEGKVWFSSFGYGWVDHAAWVADGCYDSEMEMSPGFKVRQKTAVFPDMSGRQKVTFGPRSGLIII